MRQRIVINAVFTAIFILSAVLLACETSTGETARNDTDTSSSIDAGTDDTDIPIEAQAPIAATYADYFPIGVALGPMQLNSDGDLVAHHFNRLTAETAMKPQVLQPTEGAFDFNSADKVADFARSHNMKMTGHVLVWHKQTPSWMFRDLTNGDPDDIEILKHRLKTHIETVVTRYYDVVDNWDVVNEAMSEDLVETYRTDSKWFQVFGSEAYIYWAFQYAKDAMEAIEPGGSEGKLYYNEFDCSVKSNKIIEMLNWLESEKGIRIDGVGLQGHWGLEFPNNFSIQRTMDKFIQLGYKIKISEMDLSIYQDYQNGPDDVETAKPFTPELETAQATRYGQIFSLFRTYSDYITSVTIWGISDDDSWLNDYPVHGRNDYPLLFDINHQPKEAIDAILDLSRTPE